MFVGAFNKKNNFCDREWTYKKWNLKYDFDQTLFNKIAEKIKEVLGDKIKYSVQDAYHYFYLTYWAYQIDYRSFYNYCNTESAKCFDISEPTINSDSDIELLAEESGRFFSYLVDGHFTLEKALTLVIDKNILSKVIETPIKNNLILVIGTFDEVTINSMKVIQNPNIPEIEYALEFFRLHS